MARALRAWVINPSGKNSVRNVQYEVSKRYLELSKFFHQQLSFLFVSVWWFPLRQKSAYVLCCSNVFLCCLCSICAYTYIPRVIHCMFLSAVEYTTKLQRERHTMQEEAEMLRKQIQELNSSIRYKLKNNKINKQIKTIKCKKMLLYAFEQVEFENKLCELAWYLVKTSTAPNDKRTLFVLPNLNIHQGCAVIFFTCETASDRLCVSISLMYLLKASSLIV